MKKFIIPFLAILLGTTSCEKYLDINQDPNAPSEENVTPELIFPTAEMNLASSYGNFLRIIGGYYSQHYSHDFGTSNYLDYSKFMMSATRSSGTYSQLNSRVLKNLETIREKTTESEDWGTYLAATTLRAFVYQALVDAYGEVPYSEALDIGNTSPKFDEGSVIYAGILAELNDALSKVTESSPVVENFLFSSNDASEWIPFANALKFRILMRMSKVQDVKADLDQLVAANNFPTEDIAWDGIWEDVTGKANPFYQEEFASYFGSTQINVIGNIALIGTLSDTEDGRLGAFFEKNANGNYSGGVSGTNFSTSTTYRSGYFSRPVASYDMPVYLITVAETEFFLAEYHARYGSSAEAEAHYKAAIDASFATAGVEGAEEVYTIHYPWDQDNYEKVIGIQKWIALSGVNNFEAWCELRRLKYPAFGSVTGEEIYDEGNDDFQPTLYVPTTLYTPILFNTQLGAGKVLQRLRYAESSTSRNSNAPETKPDSEPVFWAK
ncbi:SusD/RagB family nutrient-binding outer membrane lipoprotein [Parapedobacter indicus]|uniref:Starch-binding associating with outer membrane n=1 Tax=Parapedobacter indicus TaxID=1477437 RepID=A0A1I3DFM5_9SPHI|nr:SusD/RagB family nutrient-binding outer membrane lipoprotein [Parapedobacter indicus]PPL04654.1 SusD-like starch-binding protein associating with outer membrane [Parapedobacter indicus]SFH85517.1 Starch-binding associating with outer membrane [Parapedobacter indicus]